MERGSPAQIRKARSLKMRAKPMVTKTWGKCCVSARRKKHCIKTPTSPRQRPSQHRQDKVPCRPIGGQPDIGAQLIVGTVADIHVIHDAENQRKPAREKKKHTGKGNAAEGLHNQEIYNHPPSYGRRLTVIPSVGSSFWPRNKPESRMHVVLPSYPTRHKVLLY